jgi:hypothetical protein
MAQIHINDLHIFPELLPNHLLNRNFVNLGQKYFDKDYIVENLSTALENETLGVAYLTATFSGVTMETMTV